MKIPTLIVQYNKKTRKVKMLCDYTIDYDDTSFEDTEHNILSSIKYVPNSVKEIDDLGFQCGKELLYVKENKADSYPFYLVDEPVYDEE